MAERWTDERLDKFASSVEAALNELSRNQLRMMQEFSEYRRDMLEMRADIREIRADMQEMQADVREMQAEVRGLQTENRRILDHLFGQETD